ncbi:DUF2793 domain-containing protein [Novosphingobium lindaniclasticum]
MSDTITFDSASARFSLPFLYAGQSQKEVFVNEALARCDMLLHPAIEGETDLPPPSPSEGECWLVGMEASGAWNGQAGTLATFQGGNWMFVKPRDGMRVFDLSTRQEQLFWGSWRKASLPVEPLGGSTVDVQARAVIGQLVAALQALGIFPSA